MRIFGAPRRAPRARVVGGFGGTHTRGAAPMVLPFPRAPKTRGARGGGGAPPTPAPGGGRGGLPPPEKLGPGGPKGGAAVRGYREQRAGGGNQARGAERKTKEELGVLFIPFGGIGPPASMGKKRNWLG